MPAIAFSDEDAYLHPVPAWRFYLVLPAIPGLAAAGSILPVLAQKFVATHRGIDYEQVPFNGGGVRHFPVSHHTESISVTFVENHAFSALALIDGWLALIVSRGGVYGLPATYKQPIAVQALGVDGDVIATFGYGNCSPVRPDPHDFDSTQTSYLPTSTQFVTDGELPLDIVGSIVSAAT